MSCKRLCRIFDALSVTDRDTLLAFAEFLQARAQPVPSPSLEIHPHPRPAGESVVAAIKRLSATYPMLDKARMLNETSSLMAQHVMSGRPAAEVIDELEALFKQHYQELST